MSRPHHVADLSGDMAIVAFTDSPPATPATRSTSRLTLAGLDRLPEDALRKVRRAAMSQILAAKDDTRRRPWLLLWHHLHLRLKRGHDLAASNSQRMRARPLAERLADARRALGLPEPPSPVTLADRRGPDGTITPPAPPRIPRRAPQADLAVRLSAVRSALAPGPSRAVADRVAATRVALNGATQDAAVQQRARDVRAALRGERSQAENERLAQARSALGLDR
jgi:hypothetical protein